MDRPMSDVLTAETFEPHVGKAFRPLGQTTALTLVSVKKEHLPGWDGAARPPFSLLLRGPRDAVLPEGIYVFAIEGGPEIEFYAMPVHTSIGTHQDYQAVFT
jgi:hypothetical protein